MFVLLEYFHFRQIIHWFILFFRVYKQKERKSLNFKGEKLSPKGIKKNQIQFKRFNRFGQGDLIVAV